MQELLLELCEIILTNLSKRRKRVTRALQSLEIRVTHLAEDLPSLVKRHS
jgi:hypothetical protein